MTTETKERPATEAPAPAQPVPINVLPGGLEALDRCKREVAAYRRELPRLLGEGETGRFALIKGDELLSVWDTYGDATQAGCEKFGLDFFYVKEIDLRDVERFALLDAWLESQCRS